jgi:dTDP-4-amino-4,6-dideoxygalactose transaminase
MSEVNAAFGLLQLKYVKEAIAKRKFIHDYYCHALDEINGISVPVFSAYATKIILISLSLLQMIFRFREMNYTKN